MASKVVSIEDRIPKLREQRKKKANRNIILILLLFFLLVICVIYFQSPLSRVGEIIVSGQNITENKQIISASGLTEKSVVFNVKPEKVEENIKTLPEVKDAKINIKFPNKVMIEIEEYERLGYVYKDNLLHLLLENGRVIPSQDLDETGSIGPVLINFKDKDIINLAAKQLAALDVDVKNSISEIIYSPKNTDKYSIVAYMNDGYEVHATLRTFAEKMNYYPALIKQIDPGTKGILDLEVGMFFKSYDSELGENQVIDEIEQEQVESGEESEN